MNNKNNMMMNKKNTMINMMTTMTMTRMAIEMMMIIMRMTLVFDGDDSDDSVGRSVLLRVSTAHYVLATKFGCCVLWIQCFCS